MRLDMQTRISNHAGVYEYEQIRELLRSWADRMRTLFVL